MGNLTSFRVIQFDPKQISIALPATLTKHVFLAQTCKFAQSLGWRMYCEVVRFSFYRIYKILSLGGYMSFLLQEGTEEDGLFPKAACGPGGKELKVLLCNSE